MQSRTLFSSLMIQHQSDSQTQSAAPRNRDAFGVKPGRDEPVRNVGLIQGAQGDFPLRQETAPRLDNRDGKTRLRVPV